MPVHIIQDRRGTVLRVQPARGLKFDPADKAEYEEEGWYIPQVSEKYPREAAFPPKGVLATAAESIALARQG